MEQTAVSLLNSLGQNVEVHRISSFLIWSEHQQNYMFEEETILGFNRFHWSWMLLSRL